MTIQWSNQFELGHERIDAEHRIFLRLVNEFSSRVHNGLPQEALARSLREIRQYAAFHFVSEENIMEEMGYPKLAEHQALHAELLAALDAKAGEMAAGILSPRDIEAFLVDWFGQHTSQDDQQLVTHIRNIGWSNVAIINPFF